MVKFSTWQIAFCLFSLCVFRGTPSSSVNKGIATELNSYHPTNTIIQIINKLHSNIKTTMMWRSFRRSNDVDKTESRFREYLSEVQRIKNIMDGNYSSEPGLSIEKGALELMQGGVYSAGRYIKDSFAYKAKSFIGSQKNFLNNELQGLFDTIDTLKRSYIDVKHRILSIGDKKFRDNIDLIEKRIQKIINNKNNWYENIDQYGNLVNGGLVE